MDISPPPARDKLPVEKDASGKAWALMPREWLKWFDLVRKILEENVIKYESFSGPPFATEKAQGIEGCVATIDYLNLVGQGLIPSHETWHSIGYNSAIGATQEDVTEVSTGIYVPPDDAGIQMTVTSTNANDTSAGTGVREVEVHYLDGSGIEQTELVTTNGGSVNTTATDIRRINYFHTTSAGSGGAAAGAINLTNTAGTVQYAVIPAGGNFSRHGFFTIPSNKIGMITGCYIGAGSSVSGRLFRCLLRTTTDHKGVLTPGIFQYKRMFLVEDAGIQIKFDIPIIAPGLTDIKISGTNDAGIEATCYIEGFYE